MKKQEKITLITNEEEIRKLRNQVTVVLPTLNEEEAIGQVIKELRNVGYNNIIVVDGYSKDRTVEIASSLGVKVIMQYGVGKAGALSTAFQEIKTPYLLVMDADGSYDPRDIDKFLPLINKFPFIKGVRIDKRNMSLLHRIGNYIITRTFNLLFGTNIQDVCSGMYMIKTDVARNLHFEKHHLAVEQEIMAQIINSLEPYTTVPINYRKRIGGKSKTKTWRQGIIDLITNFKLAREYNPVLLFTFLTSLSLIPAVILLGYALYLYLILKEYHSGYILASLILFVLGGQSLSVATIATLMKRIEIKLNNLQRQINKNEQK